MISNSDQYISTDNFINVRLKIWQKVNNVIILIEVWMFFYYDWNYKFIEFIDQIYLQVIHADRHEYKLLFSITFSFIKTEFFLIIEKIKSLIYYLNLSYQFAEIHSVILIIHLEQYHSDSFNQEVSASLSEIVNSMKLHQVENILETRRFQDESVKMKVQWEENRDKTWKSRDQLLEDCFRVVQVFEHHQQAGRVQRCQ